MGSCRVFSQPYPVTECNGHGLFAVDASDAVSKLSMNVSLHIVCYPSETALELGIDRDIDQLFYQDLNGRTKN
jgi:hypothetical protein